MYFSPTETHYIFLIKKIRLWELKHEYCCTRFKYPPPFLKILALNQGGVFKEHFVKIMFFYILTPKQFDFTLNHQKIGVN